MKNKFLSQLEHGGIIHLILMIALLLSTLIGSHAADTNVCTSLPPELVGEWASVSPKAKFNNDYLVNGGALYLGSNGFAYIYGAPPPIGMLGTAMYDPKKFTLILDLHDNGTERLTMTLFYDPKAKTLKTKPTEDVLEGVFKHRQKKIPKWIMDESK